MSIVTAVFLDGPLALQRQEIQFTPRIHVPILKRDHIAELFSVESGKLADVCFETMIYHCVAIGFERKVALYSIVGGDRSLLQMTVEPIQRVMY